MDILGVIEESLILLNKLVPDQATRIANRIKDLRERWDIENAKQDKADDNLLGLIELELRDIRQLFSTAIKSAAAQNQP